MKFTALLESKEAVLLEQHMRKNRWLVESITNDMTPLQRKVVEGINYELKPLIEASLDPAKVKELFGEIEKQAGAAGGNRTLLGKGVDTAKKADEIVNKVGKWLQNTAPVQNFDAKFEKLKNDINKKFPDSKLLDKISDMSIWAENNPGKTAAIIGVLTAIAALAAGPVGGAIAGQILRGSVELLKGEKLSTAIGKGVKTAAYGFIAGKTFELIGDALSSGIKTVRDSLVPGAIRGNFTRIFDEVGGPLGDRYATFELKDLVGNPNDVRPIMSLANEASNAWKAGDYELSKTLWKQVQDGVEVLYTPEYVAQLASDQSTRELISGGAKAVSGLADFMGAAAQGAIAGAGAGEKSSKKEQPAKQESKLYQTRPLSEGQIYLLFDRVVQHNVRLINEGVVVTNRLNEGPMDFLKKAAGKVAGKLSSVGKNLTTKVTADKLMKAWKKAGSPTDSSDLNSFLTTQGLAPEVIQSSFKSMNIQVPKQAAAKQQTNTKVAAEKDTDKSAASEQPQASTPSKTTPTTSSDDQTTKPVDGTVRGKSAGTIGLQQQTKGAGKTAVASSPIDVYRLAKEIKQLKPEVVEAVKKMLSSKESQRAA